MMPWYAGHHYPKPPTVNEEMYEGALPMSDQEQQEKATERRRIENDMEAANALLSLRRYLRGGPRNDVVDDWLDAIERSITALNNYPALLKASEAMAADLEWFGNRFEKLSSDRYDDGYKMAVTHELIVGFRQHLESLSQLQQVKKGEG